MPEEIRNSPILQTRSAPRESNQLLSQYILTPGRLPQVVQQTPMPYTGNFNIAYYINFVKGDGAVSSAMDKRLSIATAIPWKIEPRSDARIDREIADYCTEQLEDANFNEAVRQMLYYRMEGYAIAEIIWAIKQGKVVIDKILPRASTRFVYDANLNFKLLKPGGDHKGTPLAKNKFWIIRNPGSSVDEAYANGFVNHLYWLVMFKKTAQLDWSAALTKFAQPSLHGKLETAANPEDKKELEDSLAAVEKGKPIATGPNVEVSMLDSNQRTGPSYKEFSEYLEAGIQKIILGAAGTQENAPYAGSTQEVSRSVEQQISADNRLVNRTFHQSGVKAIGCMELRPATQDADTDARKGSQGRRHATTVS